WVRRVFLNRSLVFAAELFLSVFRDPEFVPYKKHFRVLSGQKHGLWIDPLSLPGPRAGRFSPRRECITAYLFSHHDLAAGFGMKNPLLALNADCYLMAVGSQGYACMPVYAFVGSTVDSARLSAARDLADRIRDLRDLIRAENG